MKNTGQDAANYESGVPYRFKSATGVPYSTYSLLSDFSPMQDNWLCTTEGSTWFSSCVVNDDRGWFAAAPRVALLPRSLRRLKPDVGLTMQSPAVPVVSIDLKIKYVC